METVKMKEIVKYLETVIVKKGGKEKLSYWMDIPTYVISVAIAEIK